MIRAFIKAVLMGAFSASCLPTLGTTIIGLSMIGRNQGVWEPLGAVLYLLVLPTLVALCVVVPSAVLIGLPVTAILARMNRETPETYAQIGSIAGVGVVVGLLWWMDAESGWWIVALGLFSGGVTGWVWGQSRAGLNEQFLED